MAKARTSLLHQIDPMAASRPRAVTAAAPARRARPRAANVARNADTAIAQLRNLGDASADMLVAAGIRTLGELDALGSVGAYVAVRRSGGKPSLNLLYAIEGALRDIAWTDLPYHVRAALTLEADAYLDAEGMR